jgi:hypothetical protein
VPVAFSLFDLEGDDMIHRNEVKQMFEPSFRGILNAEQIDEVVENTFTEFGEATHIGGVRVGWRPATRDDEAACGGFIGILCTVSH